MIQVIGRRKLQAWWCARGTRNEGNNRVCPCCERKLIERHAQVSASERAVVYLNPLTGEHRTPARADQPMPDVYARQGFERHEIMNMSAFEKQTGMVHEATSFEPGNEPMPDERFPTGGAPKEVKESIINEIRAAHQSGDWTMAVPLMDAPVGS